jgi:hypothetical protein
MTLLQRPLKMATNTDVVAQLLDNWVSGQYLYNLHVHCYCGSTFKSNVEHLKTE